MYYDIFMYPYSYDMFMCGDMYVYHIICHTDFGCKGSKCRHIYGIPMNTYFKPSD